MGPWYLEPPRKIIGYDAASTKSTYDVAATTFNNYSEQGLLVLDVPAPATTLLAATAIALLAVTRRRSLARTAASTAHLT